MVTSDNQLLHRRNTARTQHVDVPKTTSSSRNQADRLKNRKSDSSSLYTMIAFLIAGIVMFYAIYRSMMYRDGGYFLGDKTRKLPMALDSKNGLTVFAWVKLNENDNTQSQDDIRTVISTKHSLCRLGIPGYKLYLRHTSASRYQLVLEYAGDGEECIVVTSDNSLIEMKTWAHIGFGVDGDGDTRLYINGDVVAQDTIHVNERVIASGLSLNDEEIMTSIGHNFELKEPLNGKISMMGAILEHDVGPQIMTSIYDWGRLNRDPHGKDPSNPLRMLKYACDCYVEVYHPFLRLEEGLGTKETFGLAEDQVSIIVRTLD